MTEENRAAPPNRSATRPKILCIVDGPDWIFRRHYSMFERYLADDFEFHLAFRGQPYLEADYDLIYPLEFNMVAPEQIGDPHKYVTGIRSFIAWADWEPLTLVNFLVTHFHSVHVVSRQLYDLFAPYMPDIQYVTHGVDSAHFAPTQPPSAAAGALRIGWAGNRDTYVKGFREFIQPLAALPGVELTFVGYVDRNLSLAEMPGFYQSIDAYACASSFEGNNNSLLEAAAMERAIISTPVGAVPEYLADHKSALIVDRDVEQFRAAALLLRDHPDLRLHLGKMARQALLAGGWDWAQKAEGYRRFFQSALAAPFPPPADRIVIDPPDMRRYAAILRLQYQLQRDLRIGYALQTLDLKQRLAQTEQELQAARDELQHLSQTAWKRLARRLARLKRR